MEEAKVSLLGDVCEVDEEEPATTPTTQVGEEEDPDVEEDSGVTMVEEVKLTVPETDDPLLPTLTIRTWTLGMLLCVFLAFVNQFFVFRSSPLTISAIAAQVASLFLGRFMAATLPNKTVCGVRLNPGPFNIKEHVLITMFAQAGGGLKGTTAKAVDTLALIKLPAFFNRDISLIAAVLLLISTQILGYGWAGLLRKYLVEPAQMWWPATLVDVSLFRTLHEPQEHIKGVSRLRFFVIAAVCSFAWYILPGYVFATVTSLSWICWIWKDSIFAHQLGSGLNGLGFMSISFDWATISAILGSPLSMPWPTILNVFMGFSISAYVVVPAMYNANVYNTQRYPLISNKLFLPNGHPYKISEVVAKDGLTLDSKKFKEYGPPQVTAFYVILHWGFLFASLGATVTHVILWHGKAIYRQYRTARKMKPNIHTRLMSKYNDIPSWWFWTILIGNTAIATALVQTWPEIFQLPWWGVAMAVSMSIFFTLPIGVLAATTNRFTGVGPLCDVLTGYLLPGFPMANVVFRMYSAEAIAHGLAFLRDFKLGHYMKIPPRSMLAVQLSGSIIGGLVNMGCAYWMFDNIDGLCEEASAWSCPTTSNSFSVVSLWGLVGSSRLIGAYKALNWFILAGLLAPIPFWLISKSFRSRNIQEYSKRVNMPVLLGAANQWPPAIAVSYTSWFLTGFIFNYCIFKYRQRWWQRYNYVLSAALDTGVAFAGPLIFFTLLYGNKSGPKWWGNPSHYLDHCPLAFCPTAPGINVTNQYPFCPVH